MQTLNATKAIELLNQAIIELQSADTKTAEVFVLQVADKLATYHRKEKTVFIPFSVSRLGL